MATRDTYQRVGRPSVLKGLTTQIARPPLNQMALPQRPVILRERDDDSAEIDRVARMLGVDSPDDWQRIRALQVALEDRGINTPEELSDLLDNGEHKYANGFVMPERPTASLSPLYSDVEVFDFVKTDTVILDIPAVAISTTTTLTLAQAPMKWAFTDFMVDGAVAASGALTQVEVRIILGATTITKFRLSQFSRPTPGGMVFDALQKIYSYEIGPSSVVKIEVQNINSSAGQIFGGGYVQYTYRPIVDEQSGKILRRGRL